MIFKGQDLQQQWFPDELSFLRDWKFIATTKGWTDDSIALDWLKEVFIPQTKPSFSNKRLLILDGHGSHQTDEFMYECYENGIFLVFLPAHTSHVLQPLDVSCFAPLKSAYRRILEVFVAHDDTSPIGKAMFLKTYHKARELAFTSRTIQAGFRGSGLWPINMAKPLMSPLILEDPKPAAPIATPTKRKANDAFDDFPTPRRSQDIQTFIVGLARRDQSDRTIRRLFSKVGRSLDQKNICLAEANAKAQRLEHQLDRLRSQKRQKVGLDLNERFGKIDQVIETRKKMAQVLDPQTNARLNSQREFESLCSEWQLQ